MWAQLLALLCAFLEGVVACEACRRRREAVLRPRFERDWHCAHCGLELFYEGDGTPLQPRVAGSGCPRPGSACPLEPGRRPSDWPNRFG